MGKIVVVDFSGTITQPWLSEEANFKRYDVLELEKPGEEEHKQMHGTKSHYEIVKERITEKYGVHDGIKINYVQNYGENIALSGKDVQTIIMTDLFRDAMYEIAKEKGKGIFAEGLFDVLKEIQDKGYELAIVSGTRVDIITGLFAIAGVSLKFNYIYGQDPALTRDDSKILLEKLSQHGEIAFIIGDKMSDFEEAKKYDAKSIFVTWGHPTGGEKEFADHSISKPEELLGIIK